MAPDPNFYKAPYNASNDLIGSQDRARIGGSTFTVFTWQNKPITFARQIQHTSPAPVGPGTVPIHPLDSPYPIELVTPMALTMGTLVLELYELFGANVWDRLAGLGSNDNAPKAGLVDLANLFAAVANSATPIHIFRVITPPRIRNRTMKTYTEEFHNCVISSLTDGETIEIGTMEVLKQITVNYTHITRGGKNNLLANSTQLGSPGPVGPPGTVFRG